MSPTEAAYRWGISTNTIKERLKFERRPKALQEELDQGLLKCYIKPGGKRGEWILTTTIMEKWYGPEPK